MAGVVSESTSSVSAQLQGIVEALTIDHDGDCRCGHEVQQVIGATEKGAGREQERIFRPSPTLSLARRPEDWVRTELHGSTTARLEPKPRNPVAIPMASMVNRVRGP